MCFLVLPDDVLVAAATPPAITKAAAQSTAQFLRGPRLESTSSLDGLCTVCNRLFILCFCIIRGYTEGHNGRHHRRRRCIVDLMPSAIPLLLLSFVPVLRQSAYPLGANNDRSSRHTHVIAISAAAATTDTTAVMTGFPAINSPIVLCTTAVGSSLQRRRLRRLL